MKIGCYLRTHRAPTFVGIHPRQRLKAGIFSSEFADRARSLPTLRRIFFRLACRNRINAIWACCEMFVQV